MMFSADNVIGKLSEWQPDLPGLEGFENYDGWDEADIVDNLLESDIPMEVVEQKMESLGYNNVSLVDLPGIDKVLVVGERVFEDYGYSQSVENYIWSLSDSQLESYWETRGDDYVDEWENASVAYHATPSENAGYIEDEGIHARNETRGLTNRGTGAAVFMSENIDEMDTYGDALFEIDLASMKNDGYKPPLVREEPVAMGIARVMIARQLGMDDMDAESYSGDYASDGIAEDTLVLYGDIPKKYIKRIT